MVSLLVRIVLLSGGRDPLIDGFGLIAFASLFPMLTVMIYGVITEKIGLKGEKEKEQLHLEELRHALEDAQDMNLSTVKIAGTDKRHSYKMAFSAVHLIIPNAQVEQALQAAKKAGARSVTIMQAHRTGLLEIDNFYNHLHTEKTDANLMFITQTKKWTASSKLSLMNLTSQARGKDLLSVILFHI